MQILVLPKHLLHWKPYGNLKGLLKGTHKETVEGALKGNLALEGRTGEKCKEKGPAKHNGRKASEVRTRVSGLTQRQ